MDIEIGERDPLVVKLWEKYDRDHDAEDVVKNYNERKKEFTKVLTELVGVGERNERERSGIISQLDQVRDSYRLMYDNTWDFNRNVRQETIVKHKEQFLPYVRECCKDLEEGIARLRSI
ncbi:Uncharacterized protein QTN25_001683 [Entamoeba marina]